MKRALSSSMIEEITGEIRAKIKLRRVESSKEGAACVDVKGGNMEKR